MKTKLPKETILRLIKDDLRHQHLIWGLSILGFRNENALLEINRAVFTLLGLNTFDRRLEHISDEYQNKIYKVVDISNKDTESFQSLATEIYNWLILERKKYLKSLETI